MRKETPRRDPSIPSQLLLASLGPRELLRLMKDAAELVANLIPEPSKVAEGPGEQPDPFGGAELPPWSSDCVQMRRQEMDRVQRHYQGGAYLAEDIEGSAKNRSVLLSVRDGAIEASGDSQMIGRFPDNELGRAALRLFFEKLGDARMGYSSSVDFCEEDGLPSGRAHEMIHEAQTGQRRTLEELGDEASPAHPPWQYERQEAPQVADCGHDIPDHINLALEYIDGGTSDSEALCRKLGLVYPHDRLDLPRIRRLQTQAMRAGYLLPAGVEPQEEHVTQGYCIARGAGNLPSFELESQHIVDYPEWPTPSMSPATSRAVLRRVLGARAVMAVQSAVVRLACCYDPRMRWAAGGGYYEISEYFDLSWGWPAAGQASRTFRIGEHPVLDIGLPSVVLDAAYSLALQWFGQGGYAVGCRHEFMPLPPNLNLTIPRAWIWPAQPS